MSQYAQALDAMHRLLMQAGETHWAAWIERDMREWRESRSVRHHLSAYGGMGSFNDMSPLVATAVGPDADVVFAHLKSVCYALAKNRGEDLDESALLSSFQQWLLSGWQCRSCGYAQTSINAIETHLAATQIPRLMARAVVSGTIGEVVTDALAHRLPGVDAHRKELLTLCQRAKIALVPNDGAMQRCPECDSNDTGHISWLTQAELVQSTGRRRTPAKRNPRSRTRR